MVKQIFSAILIIVMLGSCSSLKHLNITSSRQLADASSIPPSAKNAEVKFIDNISVIPQRDIAITEEKINTKETVAASGFSKEETSPKEEQKTIAGMMANRSYVVEKASALQLKYAVLLNTEVEQLQNNSLLEGIDEWYGTRYHMGGTTKKGIDCSAFVSAVYTTVYAITLPRTAREQYRNSRRISRTELQEGDLIFFNTHGGISHVGIYLQNNKFVHASATKGVTVSDMFEPYYLQRFVGAGRIQNRTEPLASY